MAEPAPPDSDLRFGQMAVAQGFVTPQQVKECLRLRFELQSHGAKATPRLSELLVGKGYLTAEQCDRLMRSASSAPPAHSESLEGSPALPAEAAAAAQTPGNVMGRYVRVRKLGEGGMGEVWRAWDRDLLRWVALKFLRYDNLGELARFQREAQTVARLVHPNIAAIYDVGDHVGRPYIAMQYIDGPTLNAFPADDLRVLARLLRDVCLGVHDAHEHGIIHRDLKPQNIIVEGEAPPRAKTTSSLNPRPKGPAFRPYVVDFGLAKETAVDSSLSVAGNSVGTPPYMSPEQIRGGAAALDVRSDVYSLGATLYEVCAGRPPFQSSDPYDLFKMIVENDPPPVRGFNPAVDADLENIIQRCLEKSPSRRYATALELAEDLERYLDGEPVLAKPSGMGYRIGKRLRKHAWLSAAVAGTVLAVGVGAALVTTGKLDRRNVLEASELSRHALESVKEAKALWRIRTSSRDQWQNLFAEALTMAHAALEKHPNLASGHYTLGEIRQSQGFWREAIQSFERAIALDPELPGAWYRLGVCRLELYNETMHGPGIIEVNLPESESFALRERRAEPHKKGAIAAFRRFAQLRGVKEEASTVFRSSQAAIAIAEGRNDEAERICDQILTETKTDEQVWLLKAKALCARNDYARALESLDVLIDEVMPQLAQAHYLRGWVREKQKDFPKAIASCTRALELNPSYVAACVTRAWARCGMSDETGMLADATRAIQIDPDFAPAYYARGWVNEKNRDLKAAVEDYGKIVALHPDYAPVYTIRGWALEQQEEWARALDDYTRAVTLGSREAGDYANCARVRVHQGDYGRALEDYDRAVEQNPRDATILAERGKAYLALKKLDPALQDFRAAVKLNKSLKAALAPLIEQCEAGNPK